MSKPVNAAGDAWITSLYSAQIGLFPLSAPAGSLSFNFSEDSLSATSHKLRQGARFELYPVPASSVSETLATPPAVPLDMPNHWRWLVENLDENTQLQAALGLVLPASGKWCLPIFTAVLQATPATPPGFLQLETGARLQLNTTVVKILSQKYGVSSRWVKAGKTASGLNLDILWRGLLHELRNSPRAAGLQLIAGGRVGLTRRGFHEVLGDLRKNLGVYLGSPLVKQYATPSKTQDYPPNRYPNLDISKLLYTPLKADHNQLRVPAAFGHQESLILVGEPATGKTTAVVNALSQGIVEQRTALVIGNPNALNRLKTRMQRADLGHLFLTLESHDFNESARAALKAAWDKPVNADSDYLQSCRQSLVALAADLDIYAATVHEPGPNQLSTWDAYAATLVTAANLNAQELDLASELAQSPLFPYQPQQRIRAARYSRELADLDKESVGGLAANPWSLLGPGYQVDKATLSQAVNALEAAITHAHPAVLEIMSACTSIETWPLFARWLDLLEIGYGREPVELTNGERIEITQSIRALKARYRELIQNAKPLLEMAREAYSQQLDKRLLVDARHAQSSSGFTRGSRLKAVLKELQPYLSAPLPAAKVVETLEEMAKIRRQSEELSALIVSNPLLGLDEIDALATGAHELFLRHADTILTSIELAAQLQTRIPDLISLKDIAQEGGNLGKQVRAIAGSFAGILDILRTQPRQLQHWAEAMPPLAKYLQVRKIWSASLTPEDSTLDSMAAFRRLEPRLKEIGLETLSQWVEQGRLSGKGISEVLHHALSLTALEERNHALQLQSFSAAEHNAQAERLAATAAETRREITNAIQAAAADFTHRLDKNQLRAFGARLREEDFSISTALRQDLPLVLARTPILGLTPQQAAQYLVPGKSRFDALVVLDCESLPAGAVVKALSCVEQVLFVANSLAALTFGGQKEAPSVYTAARQAGFPQLRFHLRYGSKLSPVVPLVNKELGATGQGWPVAWRPESATILTLENPEAAEFAPHLAGEAPGWTGQNPSLQWFEKAGNFLINLALRNKNSRLLAVTFTADMAAGIRWYLGATLREHGLKLPALRVAHLGDFPAGEIPALVFFLGSDASPQPSPASCREDLTAAFTRLMQSVSQRLWLVEDSNLDRGALPDFLRDFLEEIELPHSPHEFVSESNFVVEHLKKLLGQAGLEVSGPLGNPPLSVDIAVRGSAEAPWMGIILDNPEWCGLSHTIDREVNLEDYLVQDCGFAQIEHIYLDQLINDEDEVTRRIVSLSLDLAFPGDVTEGAVASEDRYSSPARIVAALSQRMDSWEAPHDPETIWSLPPNLPAPATLATTVAATATPDSELPEVTHSTSITPSTPELTIDINAVATSQSPDSDTELPPELRIADNIINALHEAPSADAALYMFPALAHPGTLPKQITDGEIALGKGLNTHSPAPIVFDIPQSAFTHLTREQAEEAPLPQPTLSERLGDSEGAWIANLTAPEETGKISKPGLGVFAPLYVPTNDSPGIASRVSGMSGTTPDTHFDATTIITEADPEFVPLPDHGETTIKPFVPRGKPQHDLGEKQVLDELDEPDNAAVVKKALEKILYTEGPIGTARLAKLVADAFGMQRLHPKRRDKILALLSPEAVVQTTNFGEFVWPPGTGKDRFKVFRTGSIYGQRNLTDICDEEFNNALTWVIATQEPLEEDASEAVARVLDLTPARTAIRLRMSLGLAQLDSEGRLERKGGRLRLQ